MTNKDNPNDSLIPSLPSNQDGARKEVRGADLHAPTGSGTFIDILRMGKFEKTNVLISRCKRIRERLEVVNGKLLACNSPEHLFEYGKYCDGRGLDTESELRKLVKRLEKDKSTHQHKLAKLEDKISRERIPITQWLNRKSSDPPLLISLVPTRVVESDPMIAKRNALILANRDLRILRICTKIDSEFGRDVGQVVPESWRTKHNVVNFAGAYRDPSCRHLVQKLISGAKRKKNLTL